MDSTVTPEEPDLENFWSIESVGTDTIKQPVNSTFLRTYQQSSITQLPEGMYVARFPWKEDKPLLFVRNEQLHYYRNLNKYRPS